MLHVHTLVILPEGPALSRSDLSYTPILVPKHYIDPLDNLPLPLWTEAIAKTYTLILYTVSITVTKVF